MHPRKSTDSSEFFITAVWRKFLPRASYWGDDSIEKIQLHLYGLKDGLSVSMTFPTLRKASSFQFFKHIRIKMESQAVFQAKARAKRSYIELGPCSAALPSICRMDCAALLFLKAMAAAKAVWPTLSRQPRSSACRVGNSDMS